MQYISQWGTRKHSKKIGKIIFSNFITSIVSLRDCIERLEWDIFETFDSCERKKLAFQKIKVRNQIRKKLAFQKI